jgi:hypothetical protein
VQFILEFMSLCECLEEIPPSPEFQTSTFGVYPALAFTQQNQHTPSYSKAPLFSAHGNAYGKRGHLTSAVTSYGWWLIIAAG